MKLLYDETCRALHKWLNRRSQRQSIRWRSLNRLLQRFQVPQPHIVEKNGQRMPCQREFSFCQTYIPRENTGVSSFAALN